MIPTRKNKLFIITGASGVGKSSACEVLFQKEADYIVMESDLLWSDQYNTPDDGYLAYRELWMRLCANISQIGMPVVLCGCATPDQFEACQMRESFTEIIYIAVVADPDELTRRMSEGRMITDENWVRSSCEFNQWLIDHANDTSPHMMLVNSTGKTVPEVAAEIDMLIHKNME
jgi:hypothetical protein